MCSAGAGAGWALALRGLKHKTLLLARRTYSTIYALSSGTGKCGVAVIRVSGSDASQAVLKLTKRTKLPVARRASVSRIIHPVTSQHIDTAILLWLPGPGSATGEDTCELHVHGGPAVVSAVLSALSTLSSFRPATPGEFTRRAFLSGRMDLTQVEGLADLVNAETEQQRRQALLQMEGSQGTLYRSWRSQLIKCVAHLEAYIDLSEEENIEENVLDSVRRELMELSEGMGAHLKDGRRGELLKSGVRTVILGQPNVGKSSLLNFLVGRSAAIVGPVAGTTRDVIEVTVDVGGYPMVLADTAGQRQRKGDTVDPVEREGVRRAHTWASSADLALLLFDATQMTERECGDWEAYVTATGRELGLVEGEGQPVTMAIINKSDLLSESALADVQRRCPGAIFISCYTQCGVADLIAALSNKLQHLCGCPERESPWVTQERHRQHVVRCQEELKQCLLRLTMQPVDHQLTFAAHHARKAITQLGNITGHVTTDHILDVVFRDFCVGK